MARVDVYEGPSISDLYRAQCYADICLPKTNITGRTFSAEIHVSWSGIDRAVAVINPRCISEDVERTVGLVSVAWGDRGPQWTPWQ